MKILNNEIKYTPPSAGTVKSKASEETIKIPGESYISSLHEIDEAFLKSLNTLKDQQEIIAKKESNSTEEKIKIAVKDTSESGKKYGQKLGSLLAASLGTLAVPMGLTLLMPSLAPIMLGPPGLIAGLIATSLEEKYIGVGKHIGGLIGQGAGAAVGVAKGALSEGTEEGGKIQLPLRTPTGADPKEALLPTLLHKAQKKILGKVPERTKATEIGENIGVFAGTAAGGLVVPMVAASVIGGPVGLIMSTLVGGLTGFVVGGIEENSLGLGRATGELLGTVTGKALSVLPEKKKEAGEAKEALLPGLLHKAEEKISGEVKAKTKSVKTGENIGVLLAMGAGGVLLPLAAGAIGGPVGLFLASNTIGTLLGIALMGVEEKTLGIGRAAGEVAGKMAGKVLGDKTNTEGAEDSSKSGPIEKAKKIVMAGMSIMAEPMMGFLLDTTQIANKLFAEKPVLVMNFEERTPEVNKERVVDNFIKLAGINGVHPNEEAIGKELCAQLDALKISYKQDEIGNIIASIPGTVPDSPTLVFSAHQDTVSKTSADAIRNDGVTIYTDGKHILGADDRAGIAVILEGVNSVMEQNLPHPEIKLVFTVGEEVGLVGASKLKPEDVTTRPALGFIMDSTDKNNLHLTNDAVLTNPKSLKFNFSQENPLVQVVMKSQADAGIMPVPIHAPVVAGAGTDGNTPALNNKLLKSIAIGMGHKDLHTPLERIKIVDLQQSALAVMGFITNSCDLKIDEKGEIVPRYPVT